MANWEVKAYVFEHTATPTAEHWITVYTLTDVISGKLTMTLNDTSKVSITVPSNAHTNFEPVKTLLEVTHGGTRKFFGTVTKITKDLVNGTMKVDAVGVLGSYQFLPNYLGYNSVSANYVHQVITMESLRFRGGYAPTSPIYTPSPWTEVYTPMGEDKIPEFFGTLSVPQYTSMRFTCNIEKIVRSAKNSYEFLKAITRENNYSLPTEVENPSWFKWVEDGEFADFKQISGVNTQTISYKTNLISCTMAVSPHKTRVNCYWNDGNGTYVAQEQTGSDYPNPFYYYRKALPNKDDGSPYIAAEVSNACYNELHEQNTLVEATAFDAHLADNTIPWLDMGKYVNVVYYESYMEQTAQAQITQIEYDLVDSSKDRVKLGRIVSSITDSLGASPSDIAKQIEEYLPRAGGQMSGAITYDGGTSFDGDELKIRDRYALTCNLLDSALIEQGDWDGSNPSIRCHGTAKVRANTTYTQSVSGCVIAGVVYLNSAGSMISFENSGATTFTFTTPSGCAYAVPVFKKSDDSAISVSDISNCQLEKGSQASSFVPFTMDGVEVAERLSYKKIYFTPNNVTQESGYDNCYYFKENGIVHLHLGFTTTTYNTDTVIFQLPEGFRPKAYVASAGYSSSISGLRDTCNATVSSAGYITITAKGQFNILDMCYLAEN